MVLISVRTVAAVLFWMFWRGAAAVRAEVRRKETRPVVNFIFEIVGKEDAGETSLEGVVGYENVK
jgi:hypothetical protein